MTLGSSIIVSEVSLGTTVYGCYVETISGVTTSFFHNRYMENGTSVNLYTSPSVQGQQPFGFDWGGEGIGAHLGEAYIPYYGISGKAINGVCFKGQGLDSISGNQAFNGRTSSPVEGSITYNNARVFNFQRAPTEVFDLFGHEAVPEGGYETTSNYVQHHIQVTDHELICDNWSHPFKNGSESFVICYVISSKDAVIDNSFGTKVDFRETNNPTSPPLSGISWGYEKNQTLGTYYQRQLGLSGDAYGQTAYRNSTVHMYKIKPGADLYINIYTDGDHLANVEKILRTDSLYSLYYDIVKLEHYTSTFYIQGGEGSGLHNVGYNHDILNPPTYDIDTGVCDTYSGTGSSGQYDDGTGTFTLDVDVTIPKIGFWSLPQLNANGGYTRRNMAFAGAGRSIVSLEAEIVEGYPGLWNPSNMFLNFLDKQNHPSSFVTDTHIYNYTTETPEGACGGVYIRPNTNLANSNYIFVAAGDCG